MLLTAAGNEVLDVCDCFNRIEKWRREKSPAEIMNMFEDYCVAKK